MTTARIVCFIFFALAAMVTIYIIMFMFQSLWNEDKTPVSMKATRMSSMGSPEMLKDRLGSIVDDLPPAALSQTKTGEVCHSRRCTNLFEYIAVMPMGMLSFALFWVIFLPVFYYRIFIPCYDCYDFEATVAHEVGHVLGFHHPDAEWELNVHSNATMGAATCLNPMDSVYLNPTQTPPDSIMFSMTKHRAQTCLTQDDLQGLNFLYPTCEGGVQPPDDLDSDPLCIKSVRMSGWLRLLVAVMLPFTAVALVICGCQACVRKQLKDRMISLEDTAERLRYQRAALVHKMKNQVKKRMSIGGTGVEKIKLSKSRSSITGGPQASAQASSISQTSSSAEIGRVA